MKVILLQDVRSLGKKGQLVEVKDGYARNYIFPRKLGVEATADGLNTLKMNEKAKAEQEAREKAQAQEIAAKLKDITVVITAKGGGAGKLFGAVTSDMISEALKAQYGIEIDRKKIVQEEAIKTVGEFQVRAKLGYEISAVIRLQVQEQPK